MTEPDEQSDGRTTERMSGDGPHEGEYPGQMGMPFGDEPARDAGGRRARPARTRTTTSSSGTTCGRRGASSPGGRPTPSPATGACSEFGAPAGGAGGGRDADAARAERDDLDRTRTQPARRRGPPATGARPSTRPRAPAAGATSRRTATRRPRSGRSGSSPRRRTAPRPSATCRSGTADRAGAASRPARSSSPCCSGSSWPGCFDVNNIKKDVEARPYGALRTLQLALLAPMSGLSGLVRADDLSTAVADALGRGEGDHHTLAQVKTKKSLWPRKITAAKPLRLYIAGDSMDQVFGSSLVNLSEATGLVKAKNDYKVSSGLSRPDFFDWPQRLVDQIVDYKPDAVAVLFGANDGQDVLSPDGGKVLKVGHQGLAAGLRPARGRGHGHPHQGRPQGLLGGQPDHEGLRLPRAHRDDGPHLRGRGQEAPRGDVRQHLEAVLRRQGLVLGLPQGRGRRLDPDARAGRHPPHARRRRPHGRAGAGHHREGLGDDRLGSPSPSPSP